MARKVVELSEKDKVRKKIAVWLGSSTNHIHTIKELTGNSADEIGDGNGDHIDIKLHENKRTVEFTDNCQGLPVEDMTDKGNPNYVALFETLFAGTKYDQTSATVGTNGVFLAVLTFSSERVEYEIGRPDGNVYRIAYENGDRVSDLEIVGKTDTTYTKIIFTLDEDVYDSTQFNIDDIRRIAQGQASVMSGSIDVTDMESGDSTHYEYPNGVADLLALHNKIIKSVHDIEVIEQELEHTFTKSRQDMEDITLTDNIKIKMAFQYCKEDNVAQTEYLNGSELVYHGTIQDGIVQGLRYAINKEIQRRGLYKKNEKQVTGEDVMTGFSYVVDFKSHLCEFENQTKMATRVDHYKGVMAEAIKSYFEIFSMENPADMENIVNTVLTNKRIRESAEKTRASLKSKLSKKVTSTDRIENFYDARSKNVHERVLFITEGLSALGSVVVARDSQTQACIPLRGKILNCLKADVKQIASNDIIMDLYRILGCGIELSDKSLKGLGDFNMDDLKYDKIVISTDTDVDGLQIRCLMLGMFYKLSPSLLRAGKVYFSEAPLYEIVDKNDQTYYAYTDDHKNEIIEELGASYRRSHYCKGLGEIDAPVMAETILNPDNFHQLIFDDELDNAQAFLRWLGNSIDERKDYIVKHFAMAMDSDRVSIEDMNAEMIRISSALDEWYLPYAKYSIVNRAIPSLEDGFKPIHRKILYILHKHDVKNFTKSLKAVGWVMGLSPHGDASVYDAMVRMAQGDSVMLPLVQGKGSFGQNTSRDIKPASARYTEVKLNTDIRSEVFKDISKNVVDMKDNYDGTMKEPVVLPITYPNVLVNTSSGIAVGMASNIPPFNLREVCQATIDILQNKTVQPLTPDFPTGGKLLYDEDTIYKINTTGKGSVKLRAKYHVEDGNIIVTEIPYTTTREAIIDSVVGMLREGTLREVSDIQDITDLKGMKIEITLKRGVDADKLMQKLYATTKLQDTFSANMNVIHNNKPVVMGVRTILRNWIEFRRDCVTRQFQFDLDRFEKELHIMEGLEKVILDIDLAVKLIRESENDAESVEFLMKEFDITMVQAESISGMRLRSLNKANLAKKIADIDTHRNMIAQLNHVLATPSLIDGVIIKQLESVINTFGQDRRTEVLNDYTAVKPASQIIDDYNLRVYLTREGYLKKVPLTGVKANSEHKLKDGDEIICEFDMSNTQELLLFTNQGEVYKKYVHEIEDSKIASFGEYMPSLLGLSESEAIIAGAFIGDENYIYLAYENGKLGKIPSRAYATKTKRTKVANAYNTDVALVSIFQGHGDIDILAESSIGKVLVSNATLVSEKATPKSQGNQFIKSKNGSVTSVFCPLSDYPKPLHDVEYYRAKPNAIGKYYVEVSGDEA